MAAPLISQTQSRTRQCVDLHMEGDSHLLVLVTKYSGLRNSNLAFLAEACFCGGGCVQGFGTVPIVLIPSASRVIKILVLFLSARTFLAPSTWTYSFCDIACKRNVLEPANRHLCGTDMGAQWPMMHSRAYIPAHNMDALITSSRTLCSAWALAYDYRIHRGGK